MMGGRWVEARLRCWVSFMGWMLFISMLGPFSPRLPVCTYASTAGVISSKVLPEFSGTLKKVKTQKITRKTVKKMKT